MNRILLSIGSIGVVTAIAAGAAGMTGAFFSDTETSTNNIFTAGSIDLKIDHSLSSYNGTNVVNDLTIVSDTQTTFTGDDGAGNAVALSFVHPAWTAPIPGATWIWATNPVSNPGIDQTNTFTRTFVWNGPVTSATMKFAADNYYHVVLNGNVVGDNQSLIVGNFQSDHQMDVTGFIVQGVNTITFVAKNEHVNGSAPNDNPAGIIYRLDIHGSQLFADPIDLPGTPFWNFGDVKPQDEGRDVFSLHVASNDAWACLVIKNVQNDENTLIEPEATAGDVTPGVAGVGGGELGNYMHLFLWRDLNGDGMYQPGSGETALSQGLFGTATTTLAIHDSTTTNGPLVANTPEDVGAAWCAGMQTVDNVTGVITCDGSTMGNDAQTDSLKADLEFYATQQRNQPSFKCADLNQQI